MSPVKHLVEELESLVDVYNHGYQALLSFIISICVGSHMFSGILAGLSLQSMDMIEIYSKRGCGFTRLRIHHHST